VQKKNKLYISGNVDDAVENKINPANTYGLHGHSSDKNIEQLGCGSMNLVSCPIYNDWL